MSSLAAFRKRNQIVLRSLSFLNVDRCSQGRSSIFSCYCIYICLCFAKTFNTVRATNSRKKINLVLFGGANGITEWHENRLFSVFTFNDLTVRPWQSSLTSSDKMKLHSEIVVIYIYYSVVTLSFKILLKKGDNSCTMQLFEQVLKFKKC